MINLHYDSRSLLGRIYIHAMALDDQENHNKTPRWKWNLIYDLSRFEERLRKKNPEAAKIVVQLRDEAFEDEAKRKGKNRYHYLSLLHLAARSIELEIRTEGTENNSPN